MKQTHNKHNKTTKPTKNSLPNYRSTVNKTIKKRIPNYTYLARTDYYPDVFIDGLFENRGNWHKITDQELHKYTSKPIDFIYLDGMNYLKPEYYSLKSNLKNIVDDGKRVISFKNNLMKHLALQPAAQKFILPQIEVDLNKYKHNLMGLDKSYARLFTSANTGKPAEPKGKKVYIFKPVSGMGGSGIKVFDDFNGLKSYCKQIISKYSSSWGKRDPNKENMRVFVLQEYMTDLLLVKHAGNAYKFHVRHFYIYQPNGRTSYYKNIGKMALAEEPYIAGDWLNSKIHDTHFHAIDKWSFTCEDTGISSENMAKINKQIHQFYKILDKIIRKSAKCYNETRNCFELFGVDFMITRDYKVKVLEVNAGLGLSGNMTTKKAELFQGIIDLIVDDYFPAANKSWVQQHSMADKFTPI